SAGGVLTAVLVRATGACRDGRALPSWKSPFFRVRQTRGEWFMWLLTKAAMADLAPRSAHSSDACRCASRGRAISNGRLVDVGCLQRCSELRAPRDPQLREDVVEVKADGSR